MMTLDSQLAQLEKIDLVFRSPDEEPAYSFKHALTQETAYGSLLLKARRDIHREVAEAYEILFADRLDQFAALLAEHYGAARDDAKTLVFASRAGDEAFRVYAAPEAVHLYSLALEAAKRVKAEPNLVQHLFTNRGRALELSGRYDEALANYDEMEALARARRDRSMELYSLLERATLRSTPTPVSDSVAGTALSEQALALARELGDKRAEATALRNLMLVNNFSGHLYEAVEYGEESLTIARELGLREQVAATLNDLFRPYASIGEYGRARAAADEAREFLRETGDLPMLADNLSRSARIACALGEYDHAITFSDEARQISESIGNLWGQSFCKMFVAYVYFERGEIATAIETMKECIRLGEESGFMMPQIATRADLGWVYGYLGAIEPGLELARVGLARAEQRVPTFRSWALACLTRLYLMGGNIEKAEEAAKEGDAAFVWDFAQNAAIEMPLADAELAAAKGEYQRAIDVIDNLIARLAPLGIRAFGSELLYLKGKSLAAAGKIDDAFEVLQRARAEAEALGSKRTLWQVLAALGEIEKQRGNATEAKALRMRAKEIVEFIAAQTPEELRVLFLDLPDVRAVREEQGIAPF